MKRKLLIAAAAILAFIGANAQSRTALRINEVMVENQTSIVDEYGERVGWIELFNSNFAPLEISSVYLTNDPKDPTKYPVPLGDERTKIGKRQTVVFFADNDPDRGTFHTSFVLTPGQENWIGLYDADGKTLIDEVTIPASLPANTSYACVDNGKEEIWQVRNGQTADMYITPGGSNVIKDTNNKIEKFAQNDPHGFAMAVMAMCIVFCALLVLCLAFLAISKIGSRVLRTNKAKAHTEDEDSPVLAHEVEHDSGEEIAAIIMALHQHLDAHDLENTILTINKVKRTYSPWSSKIYSMRHMPK